MIENRSMPPGPVVPELGYDDVGAAAAWPCRAFGFRERLRIADHRIQLHVVREGARIVSPPADYPFGERQYTAEDPGGHRWTFSQSIADVDPGDWGGTAIDLG